MDAVPAAAVRNQMGRVILVVCVRKSLL
jgi:hypothetical protein